MGIFGWIYPPGVSSVPGDEPIGPCVICGGNVDADKCTCKECPECGDCGCVEHLPDVQLIDLLVVLQDREFALRRELERRAASKPSQKCHTCGTEYPVTANDLIRGDPLWCDKCQDVVY